MNSNAFNSFSISMRQAKILAEFSGKENTASDDQFEIDQTCMKAAIACAVGRWEGYIESVLVEFLERSKPKKKPWGLIPQFEYMVKKIVSELNTPSWDKVREIIISISGVDPNPAWVFPPNYSNFQATKELFDGALLVRHSFAHGFKTPKNIIGVVKDGEMDTNYVASIFDCLTTMAKATDKLLAHELMHRHSVEHGWATI